MGFIADHTLGIGIGVIFLALIWKFGIQPRLGLTDREVEKKITDTMDAVEENLTSSLEIDEGTIFDKDSMPFSDRT